MQFIVDLIVSVLSWIKRFFLMLLERFLERNIFEKIIIITFIPAFFAVALPVGRYFIFDTYFYINYMHSVYLIGIVIIMLPLAMLPPVWAVSGRCMVNAFYLFWVIYQHLGEGLSKAPYELTWNYYLNIAVPLMFLLFSLLSFFIYKEG